MPWPPRFPAALGDRSAFPDLLARAYLAHSAISPVSAPVRAAAHEVLDDYARHGVEAFPRWLEQRVGLRARLARLIGGRPEEIGLVANTTTGISSIALCFPWRAGDTIVLFRGEFPTNVTPWQRAAELFGLHVELHEVEDFVGPSGTGLAKLEARLRAGGVRLIACSAVQFQTGLRMPVGEIAALAHAHGAELSCDAIQAIGSMPFDVRALGIDYLSCGSHKWLMGIEGCAFVWIAEQRVAALRPFTAGWLSHEHAVDFLFQPGQLRYDRPIRKQADFVEVGAYPTVGLAGLDVAIGPLLELGTGRIEAHIQGYLDVLERGLLERGFTSLRSSVAEQRSGILSVRAPAECDAAEIQARLSRRGVVTTIPEALLRFAPHWPNALDEIDEVLGALDEVLAG